MFFTLLTLLATNVVGQQSSGNAVKIASISKVLNEPPHIDGEINDEAWLHAVPMNGFTLFEPTPGIPMSQETTIKMLYDNSAIYIMADLKDDVNNILEELAPRDQFNNTDFFGVVLDPYSLGLNGYGFYVNPRNLQLDAQYISETEDITWDAIWTSATKKTNTGWQLEMKIPYAMLRFPATDVQKWNINFLRQMKKTREKGTYHTINPAISGLINQMTYLEGLQGINPPLRLSLFPYVTSYYIPQNTHPVSISGGMDLKYGINDAYTLDVTLIPDFGQVSFDNNVNNLTPFEVQYEERRPFFLEGLDLFSRANLFYSRRIGAENTYFNTTPTEEDKTILQYPLKNKLVNAFKMSGRGKKGLATGVFNAIESPTYATLLDNHTQAEERIKINPLTNYNIVVLDKSLKNNSHVALINTNVLRQGQFRDANVTGIDFNLRDKTQIYSIKGNGAFSTIHQSQNEKNGYKFGLEGGKTGGNFISKVIYDETSKKFDPTDLGYLSIHNYRSALITNQYNTFIPNKWRNRSKTWTHIIYDRMINPDVFANFGIQAGHFFLDKNFNGVQFDLKLEPITTYDYFETRSDFSKFYTYPTNYTLKSYLSSDYRRPFAIDITYQFRKWNEEGRNQQLVNAEPRYRFNDFFTLYSTINFNRIQNDVGFLKYANNVNPNLGFASDDVLFSTRDVNVIEVGLNPVILLSPTLSINARIRNYWTRVDYHRPTLLGSDGHPQWLPYSMTEVGGVDHYTLHIVNFETRIIWRYLPGSDIILAWNASNNALEQQHIAYWKSYQGFGEHMKNNVVSIRLNYYLDWNNLKKNTTT